MQQSITFDTKVDEVEHVALALAYAFGFDSILELVNATELDADTAQDETEETEGASAASYPGGWTKAKMRRYVPALKPTAQKVLRAIAENSPTADVETVQSASGVDGYTFAGSMSSFGFAARNTWGVKDKPFTKVSRTYEMDSGVAKLAVQILDDLGL